MNTDDLIKRAKTIREKAYVPYSSEGETSFNALAVVADTDRPVPPCGSCRQVISEFFDAQSIVHTTNLQGDVKTLTVDQLLPYSFSANDLKDHE